MDLIRTSTALGRLAAICNQRNPNISRELPREMIDSPSATLRELMNWYHSNLFNKDFNDCLERRRNDVVREIGAELGVETLSELSVEIPSELFPNLPGKLNEKAYWEGFREQKRVLQ